MKRKRKWQGPQSTLRERLEQRMQRRDDPYYCESDTHKGKLSWDDLPGTLTKPMREHMFQKTVAAILTVICLGLFSLLNQPLANRVVDAVHNLTVYQMNPTTILEAAKPVMQTVRDFNWRRVPVTNEPSSNSANPGEEIMAAPVNGVLSSPYGTRADHSGEALEMHYGIDVEAEGGAPVYAAFSGTVTQIREHPTFGLTVYVEHPDGLVTIYGRVTDPSVVAGNSVKRGQQIALVAQSPAGNSHLHFEVWKDRQPVDPEPFLGQTN